MKKFLCYLMVIGFLIFSANVSMATYIDFASNAFSGANGQSSFQTTYDGIKVSIYSQHADYPNWGSDDDIITWNPGTAGGVDGIGVNDDEISNSGGTRSSEFLYIEFGGLQNMEYVDITDLFHENDYYEEGSYWLHNSADINDWSDQMFFIQDSDKAPWPDSNGEFQLDINKTVLGIWFAGINDSPQFDYSIKGIQTAPVPEPATMLLLGVGLVGLAGFGRKKFLKK